MTHVKHAAIKLALLLAVHFSVDAALAKTESFRKLPSYKDFDGFGPDILPPDNFPVDWMEPDYGATDWTASTTGDETVFTRSWKGDGQVVTRAYGSIPECTSTTQREAYADKPASSARG